LHIRVDTLDSDFDTSLAVFTGSSFSDLTSVICNDDFPGGVQSFLTFVASAGTTIYFQVGDTYGYAPNHLVLDMRAFDPATDGDGDTWTDASELACGSLPDWPESTPERIDTEENDDRDFQDNEPLPPGAEPYDCDGDGFTGGREAAIGTNDQDPCGQNGWPSDLVPAFQQNTLNIADLGSFVAPVRRFGANPGDPNFDQRWNLAPNSTIGAAINIQDLAATVTGPTGYPLMFGWQKAFGQACRWPP
jgi:hypothetical protein